MRSARKICVVTGTRADYGLLRKLIVLLDGADDFEIQLLVTGSHLEKKYGETYKEIEADGVRIEQKIPIELNDDTPVGIGNSTAKGLIAFGKAFNSLQPDLLVVLGDRFEILSAVIAANFARVPIAHLHGGEVTRGIIDEAIRHSITKSSHLHFVANDDYRKRVIQLGEDPITVFDVGGMGVDAIGEVQMLGRDELENSLNFKFKEKNLLITYHPVTLEKNTAFSQMSELLDALSTLDNTQLIFTMPNADPDNFIIHDLINDFVSKNDNAEMFASLGQLRYLSCMNEVDAIVGNSSSGLTEAPTLKKATINIGSRQDGRLIAQSVINSEPNSLAISAAIARSYSDEFRKSLPFVKSPYGEVGASKKIFDILSSTNFGSLVFKRFFDLSL